MSPRRLALQLALATGVLSAQPSATPEVRGVVYEQGPNTPLAGAEIILTDFVPRGDDLDPKIFGTVFTNARGEFSFKPGHLGDFRIDVKKPGYVNLDFKENPRGTYFVLTSQNTNQQFSFRLMRPASVTGRVVDEDGKPVAGFPVAIVPTPRIMLDIPATTDQDGIFTADVAPGPYLIHVAPKSGDLESAIDFTEAAAKIVDQDFESSYWPGESPNARSALPVMAPPGARADVGTITLRKTNFYRVHVSISGACAPGDKWAYQIINPADPDTAMHFDSLPCGKDFLFRNFKSGSRTFYIWNQKDSAVRWASAPIDIQRENVHVELTLLPGTDVPGRLIVPEGTALSSFARVRIALQPEITYLRVPNSIFTPDQDGKFFAPGLPWTRYRADVVGLPPGFYVKEVRYNGTPITDGIVTLAPAAPLEIVLDDHPAAITGTVVNGDQPVARAEVILSKWPLSGAVASSSSFLQVMMTNEAGQFTISGLAPGEYRIAAMGSSAMGVFTSSVDLNSLIPRGEKITVERGSQQTIQVKLADPAR